MIVARLPNPTETSKKDIAKGRGQGRCRNAGEKLVKSCRTFHTAPSSVVSQMQMFAGNCPKNGRMEGFSAPIKKA